MAVKRLVLGLLLRVLIAPVWIVSVLGMCIIYPFWGESLSWEQGVLMLRCRRDSWFSKSAWAGQCWGHGIILSSQATEKTIQHELVHTEQIESNTIAGLVLGIIVGSAFLWSGIGIALWLLVWALTPLVCYGTASLVALMRGKDGYRGNHHEEAARASTR